MKSQTYNLSTATHPNATIARFQSQVIPWWKETGQRHWRRWGIWMWILVCCGVYVLVSNFWEDVWTGWNAGHEHKGDFSFEYFAVMLFLVPLVLAFMVGAVIVIGGLHYLYIYKPIFRSYRTANIVLYLIVCILIYDFFLADYVFEKLIDMNEDGEDDTYAYMIWASSLMFSIIYDYKKNEDTKKALEKERNEAQIQALKAQINPHFLFNTLNNLYGTALVEESPRTAGGIQQLAQIMRHAVESSQHERIEIGKEIRFLHDYVELQQIRLPKRDNIRIDTRITWDEEPAEITPLILMTFVENAFKYGINPAQECFVEMNLTIEKKHLTFVCRNSIVARTQLESGTGMGVENTVKRLNLLYPDRHTISIDHTDDLYEVFLTIQLT